MRFGASHLVPGSDDNQALRIAGGREELLEIELDRVDVVIEEQDSLLLLLLFFPEKVQCLLPILSAAFSFCMGSQVLFDRAFGFPIDEVYIIEADKSS